MLSLIYICKCSHYFGLYDVWQAISSYQFVMSDPVTATIPFYEYTGIKECGHWYSFHSWQYITSLPEWIRTYFTRMYKFIFQISFVLMLKVLTHWGRVAHICLSRLAIFGSDNGLLPSWRQAIIWTNAGILLIWPLGTNFSEILIEIYIFFFMNIHLKLSSGIWWPFCLGLNELKESGRILHMSQLLTSDHQIKNYS